MIQGVVNSSYEPTVRFTVEGPLGQSREIEAVVDTGYNGHLVLSSALASVLELPFVTTSPAFLADGSEVTFDVYRVTVLWDGRRQDVDAHMSDTTPLVGMRLLDRHDLSIEVVEGGRVIIQARE